MKPKTKEVIKDTLVGGGIGCAVIVPGISGGTIALVTGAFKKIVSAVDQLFTKYFIKNLLILLPFLIGCVLAIFALYFPITLAFEYCMLAIVCLFAAFMAGSIPSMITKVSKSKARVHDIILCVLAFAIVVAFGILSLKFSLNSQVQSIFDKNQWYLYPILFGIGIIASMGLIVPGFSGSMLLMVIGFYDKILNELRNLFHNPLWAILRLICFAVGVLIGFIFFSKFMKKSFEKHGQETYYVVIGLLVGSIIAIFVNEKMFGYFNNGLNTLDYVLSPIFAIGALIGSFALCKYANTFEDSNNASNKWTK